jgi:hypothetical protein
MSKILLRIKIYDEDDKEEAQEQCFFVEFEDPSNNGSKKKVIDIDIDIEKKRKLKKKVKEVFNYDLKGKLYRDL